MTTSSIPATHEDISRRAFLIWEETGRRPGTEYDNWFAAERVLEREQESNALRESQDAQDAQAARD